MNRALWKKAIVEARLLWIGCAGLMFTFMWLFVWIASNIKLGIMGEFIKELPDSFQRLSGLPVDQVASPYGQIALAYVDPVVLLLGAVWAIARGSDVVSGEIDRGTMEMLLAQPVRRFWVLWSHATVTIIGAAGLALAAWLGTTAGVLTIELKETLEPSRFLPATLNFFALTFFVAGAVTLCSACDHYRWRTVGITGAFYVVNMVVKVLGRMVEQLEGLLYVTFLGAYEPQIMVTKPAVALDMSLHYDGVLFGLGIAAYVAATIIFCRRDVPAPV